MCHAYSFSYNPGWKKMQFQLALNKTFDPTLPPLTHRQARAKEQKLTKQYCRHPPHQFSTQSSLYQN